MKNPTITYQGLAELLIRITNEQPDGVGFLENSRERELTYSQRNVHRWLEIIKIIEAIAPVNRCLDIGTSQFTFVLKQFCAQVDTLDISDHFESRCRAAGIPLYLPGSEWLEGIPEDTYDCIVFLEVIEHLHLNPETVLQVLQKKLRPGGTLILSTPNLMCFGNRLRMLTGKRKLLHFHYPPFIPIGLHGHGHDRVYTPPEMNEYLQNTHWNSFKVGYHGVPVYDGFHHVSPLKRIIYLPILLIKYLVPSTRQLMLVVAKK